jgi:hypothetical protein
MKQSFDARRGFLRNRDRRRTRPVGDRADLGRRTQSRAGRRPVAAKPPPASPNAACQCRQVPQGRLPRHRLRRGAVQARAREGVGIVRRAGRPADARAGCAGLLRRDPGRDREMPPGRRRPRRDPEGRLVLRRPDRAAVERERAPAAAPTSTSATTRPTTRNTATSIAAPNGKLVVSRWQSNDCLNFSSMIYAHKAGQHRPHRRRLDRHPRRPGRRAVRGPGRLLVDLEGQERHDQFGGPGQVAELRARQAGAEPGQSAESEVAGGHRAQPAGSESAC